MFHEKLLPLKNSVNIVFNLPDQLDTEQDPDIKMGVGTLTAHPTKYGYIPGLKNESLINNHLLSF